MRRRSGVTLIEVLVAIFVMAIGLIALLTLFPLGVLRMYQALRDERCSECAYNADKIAIMHNIRNDAQVVSFFANPDPTKLPNADSYGESYPVLVDPIGYFASPAGNGRDWVGGTPGFLRRRPVQFITGTTLNANHYKSFTLLDDISFESITTNPMSPPGTPQKSGTAILRDTRYSWAYLLRRPQTSDPTVVDCSIVVYERRTLVATPSLSLEEYVYQDKAYFNPTNGTIAIDYTANVPPPVRAGDWILDATVYKPTPTTGSAHAYFYRVTATEEFVVAGQTYARYEVQNPIRGFVNTALTKDPIDGTPASVYQGTALVIRGVAEVFEKGPVRMP
jgi:prepilin-type N-terminal cleavage/methylation domain-containing protein